MFDNNGDMCAGCKLYTYASGSCGSTLQSTFSDVTLSTANPNPIVLNSAGRPSVSGSEVNVYLSANSYCFRLFTAADVLIWSADAVAATHVGVTGVTNTGDIVLQVDTDDSGSNVFSFRDGDNTEKAQINENGDLQVDDDVTVGDATAADHDVIFDGNAQDFYVCLDDSADDLVVGLGAACGTTPALSVDENQDVTIPQNLTVSDTATFSAATAVTLSHASAVLTLSGATTPEILFSGANGNINSNTGIIFELDKDNDGSEVFEIRDGASTPVFTLTEAGVAFVNDSANTGMTIGLTLNQGGNDNEVVALKSSDVAHGMTSLAEADTFGLFQKQSATLGGLMVRGLRASGGSAGALELRGTNDGAADTTHTAGGNGIVQIISGVRSGTTEVAPGADGNLLTVGTVGAGGTRFIVDVEGDTFQDGTGGTAYSTYDDPLLALAWEYEFAPTSLLGTLQRTYGKYNKQDLVTAGIVAPDGPNGERGFVNMSALLRLAIGASWQLGVGMQELRMRTDALERENQILRVLLADQAHDRARLAALEAALAQRGVTPQTVVGSR